jgi:hypothetical protein
MRTTIDLPSSLRQKLINEAVKKNLKGYSAIIVEALERYFDDIDPTADFENIKNLRGSLSEDDYKLEIETWREGRKNWRI